MTKAEHLLQEKIVCSTPETLEAMQEQSVKFAEWLQTTNWVQSYENNLWYSFGVQDTGLTTAELYEIFNKL